MKVNMFDAQQAFGFLVSQTAVIETEVYKTQYPDFDYAALIPVDSSANEWAKVVTFFSMDWVGAAQWQSGSAFDIPFADTERARFDKSMHMAAIGYQYNIEEINTARLVPGTNLTADKADAARLAYNQFMYNIAFNGNTEKNMEGLLSYTGVTATDALADGAGGGGSSPYWVNKTSAQIIRDINSVLSGIYTGSNTVEMADTILLPDTALLYLGSTPLNDTTDTTILDFIQSKNIYTLTTGQRLTIRAQRALATKGSAGTGRMVAYKRDPRVVKLHLPMPHRFLPIWQNGPMNFVIPGIFRTGGVEIRRPAAVRYLDKVTAAP